MFFYIPITITSKVLIAISQKSIYYIPLNQPFDKVFFMQSPETSSNRSSSSMSETVVEEITIPLDMASLSQYKTGEDTLR